MNTKTTRYEFVCQGNLIHHMGMNRIFEVTQKRQGYIWLHVYGDSLAPRWKLHRCLFNDLGFIRE